MKKSTIPIVEIGMLGGIILAGYMLPDNTRLSTFLTASGICFVAGNILLVRKIKATKSISFKADGKVWLHLLKAFGILAVAWIFVWLLNRK